jgi:hypothetical protein
MVAGVQAGRGAEPPEHPDTLHHQVVTDPVRQSELALAPRLELLLPWSFSFGTIITLHPKRKHKPKLTLLAAPSPSRTKLL